MTEQPQGPAAVRRVLLLAHTGREEAREVARAFVKALSSNDIRVRALPEEAADLALDPDLLEIAHDETAGGRRLRAGPRPRRRRHHPAGRRDHPRPRDAAAGRQPRARRLPRGGRARCGGVDRRGDRRAALHRRAAAHHRRHGAPRRRAGREHVRAQRGQRREGRPRADARGRGRDRRPSAVAVRLRRGGLRDADRLDGLQLLRRRSGRLAGRRGAADGPDQRPRAVRPARWWSRPRRCWPSRCWRAPRVPACCGATAAGRSSCRPVRGSRYAAAPGPSRFVRLHEAPFTDRLVAKFGLPVQGWRGAERRRGRRCLRRSGSPRSG